MSGGLIAMVSLLGAALAALVGFTFVDAKQAFDRDPSTRTLSDYLKTWRRLSWTHFAALAAGIGAIVAVGIVLALHLLAEVF